MKQINTFTIILLLCFGFFIKATAQNYYDTICWVRVNDVQYYATTGIMLSQKAELNSLFSQYGVQYYEKAYPFSKTSELLKIHEIRCEKGKDINEVISSLKKNFAGVFDNFLQIEIPDENIMVYDPVDWMWYAHSNDWLWHLKKIQADLAWDITTGDTEVKTAVIDYSIDVNHPDLASEIYPPYDPYTGNPLPTNHDHGSAVASFVSAETAKQGEVPLAQLASVGFDTKIIAYQSPNTRTGFLQKALHSSTVMGADVIVSCAGGSLKCFPDPASGEELVMKEILNNGTVIVCPAGNGSSGHHCGSDDQSTEFYPFNSSYDERVIVVTSTDTTDYHRFIEEGNDKTHSHFATVDICAPGYKVMGAVHSQNGSVTWPYYGGWSGTSFSAPIVAGACALLKSVNKDFTPGEIQYFIKSTADPVQDEQDFHGMLGAGRLNVFRAVQMANDCSPIIISSNETWNDNKIVVCGIEVMQGACLTITSTVKLSKHSPIIVHQGGKLIIDGGYLTSLDDILWPGIEVWGNKNTHQYAVNGSYGQGYVELKNGATIENAVCALALWRPDYWSTTGGIVHAEDAVFRNNQRSVHALHYKNTSPVNGKQTDYNSWFKRCQFIVNENYLGDEDHVFHKHVDLDHVRGIKFFACDFSVSAPSSNISYWTSGIAGYEAGFSVSGMCSNNSIYPCPSYNNSTFSGFLSAISAVNDGTRTPPTITVTRSSFNNNDFGIYISNLSNTSVRFCDFNVKRQDNWLCGAGIFLENVLNYSVEENALAKTNTFNGEGYGIVIKNCAVQSKVYRNQFEDLYCGNLAWGRNILMKSSNNYIGLEYGCNTNTGNTFDFYVLGDEGVFSGLQSSQGSSLAAARNTFSTNGYHFYNGGDHRITYYYYNVAGFENEKPLIYNEDKVQIDSTNLTDNCPSNFGNGVDPVSLVLTPAEKYQREQDYYEAYTAYNGLKAVYDSRIDGGNTNNMLYDIASAIPSDMWALRAQLLGASPYLSREVLTDASDRDDVFTESVLFEILLSNPDELKKDSLMYHLSHKTNPLPQYMMNILDQVANGTTARTVMQNRMAAYRGKYTRAAGDIIRSLVNDTVLDISELRGWLANMKDIYADRDIIATYVDEGDFTNALTLANMLPSLYGLTSNDLDEHNDYVELLELYRDLYNDDRNIMQLDSTERAQVERIALQGSGYPQAMAQAVLYGTDWESYAENPFDCPTLTLPQGGQRGGYAFTLEDLGKALGLSISVKPNPATTWAAVDYTLPAKLSKATITVSNALGVIVMSTELNGNQGQKVLDLRGLADGVYLYTIKCGEYVQTGKLVIAK